MPIRSISISAWIYLAIAVLAVVDAFVSLAGVVPLSAGLIVAFIALQVRRIPRGQKIASLALIGAGSAAALASGHGGEVLIDGIARARIFLLLFFAVAWLQIPVAESPSLKAARATIVSQPQGRRYFFLSAGVHLLGSVLNLAGLGLLSVMVGQQKEARVRKRLAMALITGFGSASAWSPFFLSMVVVLTALPGLTWSDVGPPGVVIAVAIMLTGWTYDRVVLRRAQPGPGGGAAASVPLGRGDFRRTVGLLAGLGGLTVGLVETTGQSIPVDLGLMAPVFATAWFMALGRRGERPLDRAGRLAGQVMTGLPNLRGEVLVFVAANILGVGVSSAIPGGDLGAAVASVLPWADAKIAALALVILLASAAGLHPVITVIVVSALLPPAALGLADWVVGLVYLGCWGLGANVSPFSGTTLFMARVCGVPAHVIGWQWMLPPALLNGAVVAACVIVIRHLAG